MTVQFARLQHLLAQAKALGPISVAVVEAEDQQVLEGAREATDHHLITPLLIGDEKRIRALADAIGWNADRFDIISATSEDETAQSGAQLVAEGKAQAIMGGHRGWASSL